MAKRMTWEEMKKEYPDEWLLITDYETNQHGKIKTGVVERHSADDCKVFALPRINKVN